MCIPLNHLISHFKRKLRFYCDDQTGFKCHICCISAGIVVCSALFLFMSRVYLQYRTVLQLISHLSIQSGRIWFGVVGHSHSKFHNVNKTFAKGKNVKNPAQAPSVLMRLMICDLPGRLLHHQGMLRGCSTSCLEDENVVLLWGWENLQLSQAKDPGLCEHRSAAGVTPAPVLALFLSPIPFL